eukprot:3835803-Prymnesium_polylepis.1
MASSRRNAAFVSTLAALWLQSAFASWLPTTKILCLCGRVPNQSLKSCASSNRDTSPSGTLILRCRPCVSDSITTRSPRRGAATVSAAGGLGQGETGTRRSRIIAANSGTPIPAFLPRAASSRTLISPAAKDTRTASAVCRQECTGE